MARKPIELEMTGMLTPRERVWSAIRKLRRFTMLELQDTARPLVVWHTARTYLKWLLAGGYIQAVADQGRTAGKEQFDQVQYQLVKDSFEAPRVTRQGGPVSQGTATLAMWRAMKVLKEFDYIDVQRAASVGPKCLVKPSSAKAYVNDLAVAGYFSLKRQAKPGTPARWRLVRDTGAHAPAITRRKGVFDRNLGAFTLLQSEQEVCDGLE
jgi:hypothetical protein